jgi:hypothetical protein
VSGEANDYVTIIAPSSNGGSDITEYNWESSDGKSGNRSSAGEFVVAQEAGTSQTYRVRAVNGVGASEWSSYSDSITTPTPPPFFPPFFPFFPPYFPYFPYFDISGCPGGTISWCLPSGECGTSCDD